MDVSSYLNGIGKGSKSVTLDDEKQPSSSVADRLKYVKPGNPPNCQQNAGGPGLLEPLFAFRRKSSESEESCTPDGYLVDKVKMVDNGA